MPSFKLFRLHLKRIALVFRLLAKRCPNLHVSLVDPERLAELDVGDEKRELAIKVQQENPATIEIIRHE